MSLSRDGRTIHCDGAECSRAVPAPVATKDAVLSRGWLFQTGGDEPLHLCPHCLARGKKLTGASNLPSGRFAKV